MKQILIEKKGNLMKIKINIKIKKKDIRIPYQLLINLK